MFPLFELLRKMLILDGVSFSACLLMVDWKIGVSEFRGVHAIPKIIVSEASFFLGLASGTNIAPQRIGRNKI